MNQITVSIFMLTYNQENYIAQAIEGVLMQKTNFNYQLVIGEDCSKDSTMRICEHYAKQYNHKIKLLPSLNRNIGLVENYFRTIKNCHGKYIAICDGDDYWIDEYKLQKQVDFLETNPEFYIVATHLKRLYKNGKFKNSIEKIKRTYTFEDLIFDNFIPSVTVLFKNIPLNDPIPIWIKKFPYGDWPTYLWVIKNKGKIHILNDVTAVYRTDIGISAKIRKKQIKISKINLNIIKCIASDLHFLHKKEIIKKSMLKHRMALIACYNRERQYMNSFKLLIQSIILTKKKYRLIKFYLYSLRKSLKLNI